MKLVNADYGIDSVAAEENKRTWYHWYKFPLLPMFEFRRGDDWNAPDFTFSWLNLRIHSLMAPQLSIGATVDEHGARLDLNLPYLKVVLWLMIFPDWVWKFSYEHFWRLGSGRHADNRSQ